MTWRATGVLCAMALGSFACGRGQHGPAPDEPLKLPPAAAHYVSTTQRPFGSSSKVAQLRAEVAAALNERGDRPEPDGALDATAAWLLNNTPPDTKQREDRLDMFAQEAASRRFGFGGIVTRCTLFGDRDAPWRRMIATAPANTLLSRFGVAVSTDARRASIVWGSAELQYEPIPRRFEVGDTLKVKGSVDQRYDYARVFLERPDGSVPEHVLPDRAFDLSLPLDKKGRYRVEMVGDGATTSAVVLANLPLYVGVAEPAPRSVDGQVVGVDAAEERLLALLSEARRAARVGDLQPDGELREIALAHSSDMAESNFVGHLSPKHGTTWDRVFRWDVRISLLGENIAMADTPEAAHAILMRSPGHMVSMVSDRFTHVGIGVRERSGYLLATQIFGRRPDAATLPASAAEVEAAIVELRRSRGVPAAKPDLLYRIAAEKGAARLAAGVDPDGVAKAVETALQLEVDRRATMRPGGCVLSLQMLELAQLEDSVELTRPSLKRFGVGSRMRHDEKGAILSTVLFLEDPEHCQAAK